MTTTLPTWRRFIAPSMPSIARSSGRVEAHIDKADLRHVAARLLVLAERCPEHAETMRRSAALFQILESGDLSELTGLSPKPGAAKATAWPLPSRPGNGARMLTRSHWPCCTGSAAGGVDEFTSIADSSSRANAWAP